MELVDIHICCQVVFGFVYVLVREGSVTWKRLVKNEQRIRFVWEGMPGRTAEKAHKHRDRQAGTHLAEPVRGSTVKCF